MRERNTRRDETGNREPKRVLIIPWWYPSTEDPVTGIFIRNQARAVGSRCAVCVLVSRDGGWGMRRRAALESDKTEEGVRTVRMMYASSRFPGRSFLNYCRSIRMGFEYLQDQGFDAQIVHAHEFQAAVAAVRLGRRHRFPALVTEHWSGFARRQLRRRDLSLARYGLQRVDAIVTVSRSQQEHIKACGIENTFHIIGNPVDTAVFHPDPPAQSWDDGHRHILFVGRLMPVKGLSVLLDAIALVATRRSDVVLDVVGDGPDRNVNEEQARMLSQRGIVRFHGTLDNAAVAELIKRCLFLVSPSLWETFGAVLIEAMACGKPVLATEVGGVPEVLAGRGQRMVPARDPATLADAIIEMLDSVDQTIDHALAERVIEKFSLEAIGRAYADLYDALSMKRQE